MILDSGGAFLRTPEDARTNLPLTVLKAGFVVEGLNRLGLSLYNVGTTDLLLGEKELRKLMDRSRFPWLASNLRTSGGDPLARRTVIREEGGLRVGYFGLLSESAFPEDAANPDGFRVSDPITVGQEMTDYLQGEGCDLVVALTSLGLDEERRLGKAVAGIDIIFGGLSRTLTLHPERAGSALVVQAGAQGTHVALLEATAAPGAAPGWTKAGEQGPGRRYRWELTPLAAAISDDPELAGLLARYQDELRERALAEPAEPLSWAGEGGYRGANSCAVCHQDIYREWLTSSHAQAFAVLERQSRAYNFECFSCHVTGYGKSTGFSSARLTPHLKGVQCEACHGPGGRHRLAGEMTRPAEADCRRCHDGENSPAFDFPSYRDRLGGHVMGRSAPGGTGP